MVASLNSVNVPQHLFPATNPEAITTQAEEVELIPRDKTPCIMIAGSEDESSKSGVATRPGIRLASFLSSPVEGAAFCPHTAGQSRGPSRTELHTLPRPHTGRPFFKKLSLVSAWFCAKHRWLQT